MPCRIQWSHVEQIRIAKGVSQEIMNKFISSIKGVTYHYRPIESMEVNPILFREVGCDATRFFEIQELAGTDGDIVCEHDLLAD